MGGPIDTWSMCLNCILQDLFRDTPLDHILLAQIRKWHIAQIPYLAHLAYFAYMAYLANLAYVAYWNEGGWADGYRA